MKQPIYGPIYFQALVEDISIDAEDAGRALTAKIENGPRSQDPERFLDDAIIDSFVNSYANGKTPREEQCGQVLQRMVESKDFAEKLARGLSRGRQPMFSDQELFVLRNWRKVKIGTNDFPGLWEWSPKAAAQLLSYFFEAGSSESSFTKIWKGLSLVTHSSKLVVGFIPKGSDKYEIETKNRDKKMYFCRG